MDIHIFEDKIDLNEAKLAHINDIEIQEKYNVKYHQYWINQAAQTAFCLVEGPDKETCARVHFEANGFRACQIVEVEGGMYDLFMGKDGVVEHGLVRRPEGKVDDGYRFILSLDITQRIETTKPINFYQIKRPHEFTGRAIEIIKSQNGKEIPIETQDCLLCIFQTPENALEAAYKIKKYLDSLNLKLSESKSHINYYMGINVGQPLTEKEGFFEIALKENHRLRTVASNGEIITNLFFEKYCNLNNIMRKHWPLLARLATR